MGIGEAMNNFKFGEVLTRAWQIIWQNKVLWIFGIMASCARGNGGGNGGGGNSGGYQSDPGDVPFSEDQLERSMTQFGQYLTENIWIIIAVAVFIILLSLVFYFLGMMGRVGLIQGTYKVENGAATLAFGEVWSESLPYFWRVLGLNFLIGLALFIIFVPFIFLGIVTAGIGFLCIIPLICILIPLGLILNVVIDQAQAAIVIENLGMWEGFKRGWEIVKSNIGVMIVMALILIIGGAVLSFIISLPIILAVIPLVIGASSLDESLTPLYIAIACCAAYLPVIIFLNGILTAYIQSAWTLTYLRLTKPKEENAIIIEANA
jgi:hypothetical protein